MARMLAITHIASGDAWGGAEAQLMTLLVAQKNSGEVAPSLVCLNNGELAARARAAGIDVTVVDETTLGGRAIISRFRALFKQLCPDVIHSHRQKENVLACFANELSVRAKSVRTQHGAPEYSYSFKQRIFDCLDTFAGKFLQQAIIAVSADLATKLTPRFGDKVEVIYNGLDVQDVQQSALPPRDFGDGKHVGLVGRLEQVKRVDLFCAAARLLPGYHFHVFGAGSLLEQLQSEAPENVLFHGHCSDINACIAGLDVLVMCSDHEGLPMTLLEAVALQTPVVARRIGGIPELLKTVDGPILVDEHSAAGYAAAIDTALALGSPRATFPHGFTALDNHQHIMALYQKVLGIGGGR